MNNPIRYVEAVRHIMTISSPAVSNVGQMQRAAEAAGYSMLAFNGQIWARDDDSGGRWIKTPLTLDALRC